MKRHSIYAVAGFAVSAAALLWFGQRTQRAEALPTFAQAYGVDCSACHTSIPALNAYGRYIQATAFGALDPTVMKRSIPVVVRESVSFRSTGKLDRVIPQDKWTKANLSVNVVGVLSKSVSYRFEQSLYSNDLGGGNTGHFWIALNQIFGGNGHLMVGKIDTPAAAAFSNWGDMTGFSSSGITVGQHAYNIGGQRWGVGFNYVPLEYAKHPFKAELAYVGNSPPMFNASAFDSTNPYAPGGAGSDKSFSYKVAWARPDRPVEAGLYGSSGTYVLAPGFVSPIDRYSTAGAYAQRDPERGFPGLLVFYQRTFDSNVGPGKASQHLRQSASSWSYALEIDQPLFNGNVLIGFRPVEYIGGLQASKSGYDMLRTAKPHFGVVDLVLRDPKISPYLYVTIESAGAAASNAASGGPTWRAAIRWASPVGPVVKPQH